MEVESPAALKQLTKSRQRNEVLSGRLSNQNERCKQLEEQIRKSDEHSCNLQHKVSKAATITYFYILTAMLTCALEKYSSSCMM